MNQDPFKEYRHESEPGKKERYQAWRAAIGLQAVDGLETSSYLLDTAKRHIGGEISIEEVKDLLTSYYEKPDERKRPYKRSGYRFRKDRRDPERKVFQFYTNAVPVDPQDTVTGSVSKF